MEAVRVVRLQLLPHARWDAVVAAIVPADAPVPRPVELVRIDVATDDVAVAGIDGYLGDALLVGDWSA